MSVCRQNNTNVLRPLELIKDLSLMEGAGQNLERRFRLPVWQESMLWMQSRCSDLLESGREADAKSVLVEFRIHEII